MKAYQKSLRALAKRMKKAEHRKRFEAWADETAETEAYTQTIYKSYNPRLNDILLISPTTQLYMGWEAQAVTFMPVHEPVAAVLPCFWSYGDPAYEKTVDEAMRIGSDSALGLTPQERMSMTAAFLRSNRMEWMLWDAAWRLETWPTIP